MKDVILKGDVTIINATNEELLINSDLLQQCYFKVQDNKIILEDVKIEVYRIDNKIKLKITKKGYAQIVYEAQQLITKDFFNETKSYISVVKKADEQTKELALSNPTITVSDYADKYYVAEYWRDCDITGLKNLYINPGLKNKGGIVKMKDVILKGDVTIINATNEELLINSEILSQCGFNMLKGKRILENVKIEAYEQGDEIMLKITQTDKKERIYKTDIVFVHESFGITKKYIRPYIARERKLVVEKAKQWLEQSCNEIISMFKEVPKIVAVVDVDDDQAIVEAVNYAKNGIKVELVFVGQREKINEKINRRLGTQLIPTTETNKIYGIDNLSFELKNSYIKNLEITTYELVSGGEIKLLDTVNNIIEGLDSKNKNIMYVSKNLLDTSIENLKSIEKLNSAVYDKKLLAYSTDSIKVAMVKGITALKGILNKALSNMTVKTKNIMATYSISDIRKETFKQDLENLVKKGINTIILKIEGDYFITDEEIKFFTNKGINVFYKIDIKNDNTYILLNRLNKLLGKYISPNNVIIDFKGKISKEIIDKLGGIEANAYYAKAKFIYNSHNLPANINKNDVKLMLDYKNAIEMIKKGEKINDGSIVYIAPQDGENIVVSTKDIKNLVNVGVSLAFDAQVINDIDSQDISKDGITMLEIIKSMFSQTPEAKLAREKAEGKIKGREFALNNKIAREQVLIYYNKIDNLIDYVSLITKGKIKAKSNEQAKAILTGMLEVEELKKLIDISAENLRDDILSENADKLLEMLGEYRVLTKKSFTREYGKKIVDNYANQSMHDILNILEQELELTENTEKKSKALAGIIYILLDDRLKIKEYKERIIDMDINQIKAMLTAA